jgi:hypothetical protein
VKGWVLMIVVDPNKCSLEQRSERWVFGSWGEKDKRKER